MGHDDQLWDRTRRDDEQDARMQGRVLGDGTSNNGSAQGPAGLNHRA